MGRAFKSLVLGCGLGLMVAGCTTSAQFRVPENSKLYVDHEPIAVASDGEVSRRPFGWNCNGGIPYSLEKDGKIVQQGTLPGEFRFVSVFWPPYALLYWPVGFKSGSTYDLTKGPVDTSKVTVQP